MNTPYDAASELDPLNPYAGPEESRPNAATRISNDPSGRGAYVAFLRAECNGRAYNLELVRHLKSSKQALDLLWVLFYSFCFGILLFFGVGAVALYVYAFTLVPAGEDPMVPVLGALALIAVAGLLVGSPLVLGGVVAVIKAVRNGGAPQIVDLLFFFRGIRRYTRAVVACLCIWGVPYLISMMMRLIPIFQFQVVPTLVGVYLNTRLFWAPMLFADRNGQGVDFNAFDAIKGSWAMTAGKFWGTLWFYLVLTSWPTLFVSLLSSLPLAIFTFWATSWMSWVLACVVLFSACTILLAFVFAPLAALWVSSVFLHVVQEDTAPGPRSAEILA